MTINSVVTSTCVDAVNLDSDNNLGEALEANVNVSHLRVVKPRTTSQIDTKVGPKLGNLQSVKGKPVSAEVSAKHWNIDQRKALNTIKMTTQRGVRTVLHPSLSKRYPTNNRMLMYKRLPHPVFLRILCLLVGDLPKVIKVPRCSARSMDGHASTQ